MNTVYIKEMQNKRITIKSLLNKIDILNDETKTVYFIPVNPNKKIHKFRINMISKKIIKLLEQEGTNRVVLSEYLKKVELLKNNLYSENINVLNGRFLFKCLSLNIIKYILKIKDKDINKSNVCILVNDFTSINTDIIIEIAKSVKSLSIVTNNIQRFKKIENYLYSEYGILLNIVNNKKTSLLRSQIIINIDFPEELINKYRINLKAIIINTNEKIKIYNKKFSGINANYYKIRIPKKYKLKGFLNEEIYESIIYDYSLKEMQNRLEMEDIELLDLIGNNGTISKKEIKML